jgi:hypothetical protein
MKTFLLAALVAMPSALPATVEKQQAPAATLVVPFDFSRGAIEVDIVVRGTPLHALVDTGVNPSVIALSRALELGLPVDRGDEGEASGFGNGKGAAVFPSAIDGLSLVGGPWRASMRWPPTCRRCPRVTAGRWTRSSAAASSATSAC